ncbi:MAG: hypothetical protein A2017_05610 [Lentisphaerae bacterium GWF2_44_16]|nr:MAG: hypothetical protein A2017_05610 [Lentisphaerae bacterium GWF2_44_16]
MDVKGKRVLVTGGAVRIGKAICQAFAHAGSFIVIHYNRSGKAASELLSEIGGETAGHRKVQCELSTPNAAKKIFTEAGPFDILINNASIYNEKSISEETPEEARKQFEINFKAPFELMKQLYSSEIQEGCIINILDQRINKINSSAGSYALSKKVLADTTLISAIQWAPRIRVNAIAPGPVLPPVGMENSKMEKTLKSVPMAKAVSMDDLTNACLFLAENNSITGQILYVDGGQHLHHGYN